MLGKKEPSRLNPWLAPACRAVLLVCVAWHAGLGSAYADVYGFGRLASSCFGFAFLALAALTISYRIAVIACPDRSRHEIALRAIAANTCCDRCREASLVAKQGSWARPRTPV